MSEALALRLTHMATPSLEAARRVKNKARDLAARHASVAGVGLTRVGGDYAVKVSLHAAAPLELPSSVDGVRVIYEVTGPVRPRSAR